MSKVKNISGGQVSVGMLGRDVEDGEIVEVPDFQLAHNPDSRPGDPDYLAIAWPPNRWEPVTDKAAKSVQADNASGKAAS